MTMKKKRLGLLAMFCLPLLMANSPAPNPYPSEYTDFELTNAEMEIIEVEDGRELVFRGDLKNVGTGLIDLEYSDISYRFERTTYQLNFFDYNVPEIADAIVPNQTYHYEINYPYNGTTPVGIVEQYVAPTIYIVGFSADAFMNDVIISDIAVNERVYDVVDDVTISTVSFAWSNQSDRTAYSFYFYFSIGETQYVKLLNESLDKNQSGTAETELVVPGNIVDANIENTAISYLPINPYYDQVHFGFLGLIGFLLVIGIAIIIAPPLIILIVFLIVKAVSKKKAV